jgi:hypothetical protein
MLWMDADSDLRREITQTIHILEQQLQRDPSNIGESRTGQRRIHFVPPLGIYFAVDDANMVVRVLKVWQINKGG